VLVDVTKDVLQAQGHYQPVAAIHLPGTGCFTEGHTGQFAARRNSSRKPSGRWFMAAGYHCGGRGERTAASSSNWRMRRRCSP